MTEEEISKKQGEILQWTGSVIYNFFLPLLEVHEAFVNVLQLNRQKLKLQQEKAKPEPVVAPVPIKPEGAPPEPPKAA